MAPKAAKKSNKKYTRPQKAASTKRDLQAGTVAIMLAGKYRGKHCVVLKSLKHGTKKNLKNGKTKDITCGTSSLVVSGPYKVNGIPIRRVNPRYVIATSTKVNLGNIDGLDKINNDLFKRAKQERKAKSAAGFMKKDKSAAAAAGKKKIPDERVALQKKVDAGVIAAIKKDANGKLLPGYLRSVFTLKPGDQPHRMKF